MGMVVATESLRTQALVELISAFDQFRLECRHDPCSESFNVFIYGESIG